MDLQTMRAIVAKADNPDVEIQRSRDSVEWHETNDPINNMQAASCAGWFYRIKPNTITLNGRELPRPSKINYRKMQIHKGRECIYYIDGILDVFSFNLCEDAQAWADALNELMGEGK